MLNRSMSPRGGSNSLPLRCLQVVVVLGVVLLLLNLWSAEDNWKPIGCPGNVERETVPEELLPKYRGPPVESPERFTLILNSFHRPDLMRKSIGHYSKCPIIEEIRVIWCEDGSPPSPEADPRHYSPDKLVVYDVMPDTSLNNRFRPIHGLKTEAIMSIDDDIYVPCSDLVKMFQAWSTRKRQLVGFFPRAFTQTKDCGHKYYLEPGTLYRGNYGIVLSKAALLHRDYLELYTYYMPKAIRDYVDTQRNCEDLALQFLVANITHEPPEFVNSLWIFDEGIGPFKVKGISSGAHHLETRSSCLNQLSKFYGGSVPLETRKLADHGSLLWIRATPVIRAILHPLHW